jgi:hypothetical protein
MILQLIRTYLRDAVRTYQSCAEVLGLFDTARDLISLRLAAGKGNVARLGEVVTLTGVRIGFHIHGAGYSFTDHSNGKRINFDVDLIGDRRCIRLSIWCIQEYASSVGEELTREAVEDALREAALTWSQLIHVTNGPFDNYCYPASAVEI